MFGGIYLLVLLKKINTSIVKLIEYIIIVLFAFLIVCVGTNVFFRYVLKSPLFWVTEASCYALVYLVMLGSIIALYKGEHVKVNVNFDGFQGWIKKSLEIITNIVVFGFLVVFIILGFILTKNNMASYTGTLPIPMGCVYIVAPISGILAIPLYLEQVLIKEDNKEL